MPFCLSIPVLTNGTTTRPQPASCEATSKARAAPSRFARVGEKSPKAHPRDGDPQESPKRRPRDPQETPKRRPRDTQETPKGRSREVREQRVAVPVWACLHKSGWGGWDPRGLILGA